MVSASSTGSMLIGMLRGLLVARALGPTYQGVLSAVNLVLQYSSHAHLGLLHGMNKLMPFYLGREDQAGADECRDTGVSGGMLLSSVGSLVVYALVFVLGERLGFDTRLGLLTAGAVSLLAQFEVLYHSLLRTYGAFHIISALNLIGALLELVLMVLLARAFSIRGALLALFARHFLGMLLVAWWSGYRVRWALPRPRVRELSAAGLPLLVLVMSDHLLRTADRLVILRLLHAPGLGFYTIGTVLVGFMYALPRAVGYVMFPRYMELRGREVSTERTRKQLLTPLLALACSAPFMAGACNILVPWVVHRFLEKFEPGVPAAQWLVWSPALQSLGIPGSQAMVAADQQWWVMWANVGWIPVVALLSVWLSRRWHGLIGPAVAALICQAGNGATVLVKSLHLAGQSRREKAATIGGAYLLAGYMAGALFVARWVGHALLPGPEIRFSWCGLTLLTYLILATPVLGLVWRRLEISQRLRRPAGGPPAPDLEPTEEV